MYDLQKSIYYHHEKTSLQVADNHLMLSTISFRFFAILGCVAEYIATNARQISS
jgi:hypothetical protein